MASVEISFSLDKHFEPISNLLGKKPWEQTLKHHVVSLTLCQYSLKLNIVKHAQKNVTRVSKWKMLPFKLLVPLTNLRYKRKKT